MRSFLKLFRITTADISLHALLEGQLRFLNQEFEVVGVAADSGLLKAVGEREGIRVIDVPMHREIAIESDIKCLFKLYRLFKKEKPYIVHSNTPKGSLLSLVAANLAGVPNRIYTVTGLRYQGERRGMRWLLKSMEKIACANATKIIPEGEGVKSTLISDRITKKPLAVIHNGSINGIDLSFFSTEACGKTREDTRRELSLKEDDFVFIFIGRIVRDKGMNELAEVLKHPLDPMVGSGTKRNAKLILVGPLESEFDPLKDGNEEFFKTSEIVRYVGYQSDVRPYLLASDALVFPSYREGFPNVVMQAGAMGVPSIVTDINGCNEIIEDGVNGRIIPPRDAGALGRMMDWFLDHPAEVSEMASKSREMIKSRYERQDVWDALLKMYKEL